MNLHGRRVTVMGLGHFGGGVAAVRWLARQGAVVTVTDLADETALTGSLAMLEGVPIAAVHLGGHREEDFRTADLVVVNPAVRPGNPFLEIARQEGVPLSSEAELFLRACPARVVGVTGTNGKSTTAAMIAAILRSDGRRTWLGGNIGTSLLDRVEGIARDDWVVLELSSFQLARLGSDTPMPQVAVVTGCRPNHLDWHPDYTDYVAAKQRILTGQSDDSVAVLNTGDAEVALWQGLVRGRLLPPAADVAIPRLRVPGGHNRANAALAAAAARGAECREESVRAGLSEFTGLPGRLEMVAVIDGRRFFNDTTSTTPESTVAALESMSAPTWLLAGGRSKGADLAPVADAVARLARGAAFFGAVRDKLFDLVGEQRGGLPVMKTETLAEAFRWCWSQSRPAEAILLSPGCSSGDQYRNFRRRGEDFLRLVRGLAGVT